MKKSNEWKYELNRRGRAFVIYQMEHVGNISTGTPVYRGYDYEEARKELYRLNGWKYKLKQ